MTAIGSDSLTTAHRSDLMPTNSVIIRCMRRILYSPATCLPSIIELRGRLLDLIRNSSFQPSRPQWHDTLLSMTWPSSTALVSPDFYLPNSEHMHKWVHSIKIHHECNSCWAWVQHPLKICNFGVCSVFLQEHSDKILLCTVIRTQLLCL